VPLRARSVFHAGSASGADPVVAGPSAAADRMADEHRAGLAFQDEPDRAASAPAAKVAGAVRPASPGSLAAAAAGIRGDRVRRDAPPPRDESRRQAPLVVPLPAVARQAVERFAAETPVDASRASADARAEASCRVLRCVDESSAEQTGPLAMPRQPVQRVPEFAPRARASGPVLRPVPAARLEAVLQPEAAPGPPVHGRVAGERPVRGAALAPVQRRPLPGTRSRAPRRPEVPRAMPA